MTFRQSWTFPSPGSNNLEPESINYLHRRKDYGEDKEIYGEENSEFSGRPQNLR